MKILHPVTLEELREHEGNCDTAVVLGSHEMDRYASVDGFSLYRAVFVSEDIEALYLLNCGFSEYTRGGTGRLKDIEDEKIAGWTADRIESFINPPEQIGKPSVDLRSSPHLAITVVSVRQDGPWVIIDGNHRAIAHYRMHGSLDAVSVYLCVHSGIMAWPYMPNAVRALAKEGRDTGGRQADPNSCSVSRSGERKGSDHPEEEESATCPVIQQVLNLCARIEPHPEQQELFVRACVGFSDWDELLQEAEAHGMGPLLHRQLSALELDLPNYFLRSLRLLCLRHRQTNILLTKVLTKVLKVLETEGIPALVLKGAALCHTLYPKPGHRPMRDIDLLLPWDDALPAHALLQRHGFEDPCVPTPVDHLHLAVLHQNVEGRQVSLELHRNLYPDCPPCPGRVDFDALYRNAESFVVDGVTAYTLGNEDMLQHLYQHGFHAPLTYNPYKLVSAADIVGFVEARLDDIDWERIKAVYPHLFAALPYFHHLTPWNDAVREKLSFREVSVPSSGVGGRFTGWPRRKLEVQRGRGLFPILRDTFCPPTWWLWIYYAPTGPFDRLWTRLLEHPSHIFWWIKLYWDIFLRENLPSEIGRDVKKRRSIATVIRNFRILAGAMYRKIR